MIFVPSYGSCYWLVRLWLESGVDSVITLYMIRFIRSKITFFSLQPYQVPPQNIWNLDPPSPLSAFSVLFVRKIGIFLGPSPSMVQTYLMEAPVSTICRRKGEVYALIVVTDSLERPVCRLRWHALRGMRWSCQCGVYNWVPTLWHVHTLEQFGNRG